MRHEALKTALVDVLRAQLAGTGGKQVPAGGELLWTWFVDLHHARSWHMSGPNPISYAEIAAYGALTRQPIAPAHIDILKAMDRAYIAQFAMASRPPGPVSKTAISAGLFDAMFG